jgi:hypothetical protein
MGKDVLSPVEAWRVYDEWRSEISGNAWGIELK